MGKRTAFTFAFQMSSDKEEKTKCFCAERRTSPNQSDVALLKEVLEKLIEALQLVTQVINRKGQFYLSQFQDYNPEESLSGSSENYSAY